MGTQTNGNHITRKADRYLLYDTVNRSPDDVEMGKPGSKGCVRMKNSDVIELFDLVEVGTRVTISEK